MKPGSCNFAVWWDGDLLRELLDRNHISKWNWETQTTDRLLTADGCTLEQRHQGHPVPLAPTSSATGARKSSGRRPTASELRIYTTTIPTEHRFATLMHDPQLPPGDRLAERRLQPAAASGVLSG